MNTEKKCSDSKPQCHILPRGGEVLHRLTTHSIHCTEHLCLAPKHIDHLGKREREEGGGREDRGRREGGGREEGGKGEEGGKREEGGGRMEKGGGRREGGGREEGRRRERITEHCSSNLHFILIKSTKLTAINV